MQACFIWKFAAIYPQDSIGFAKIVHYKREPFLIKLISVCNSVATNPKEPSRMKLFRRNLGNSINRIFKQGYSHHINHGTNIPSRRLHTFASLMKP